MLSCVARPHYRHRQVAVCTSSSSPALGSARPPAGCVRGFDDLVTELVSDAVGR